MCQARSDCLTDSLVNFIRFSILYGRVSRSKKVNVVQRTQFLRVIRKDQSHHGNDVQELKRTLQIDFFSWHL